MRKTSLLITALLVMISAHNALAHRPEAGNPEGVTPIPDPTTSYAFYRELAGGDTIHVYQLDGRAGTFFHAGINIPRLEGLADFGVTIALLGPGLPALSPSDLPLSQTGQRDGLPVLLPQWARLAGLQSPKGILAENIAGEVFYEPFTQTSYWGRQELELDLPEDGRYTLLVWNEDQQPGKYVLDTGTREVFGLADLLQFPRWWVETRLYFNQGPALAATAASTAILAFAGLAFARRTYKAQRIQ